MATRASLCRQGRPLSPEPSTATAVASTYRMRAALAPQDCLYTSIRHGRARRAGGPDRARPPGPRHAGGSLRTVIAVAAFALLMGWVGGEL